MYMTEGNLPLVRLKFAYTYSPEEVHQGDLLGRRLALQHGGGHGGGCGRGVPAIIRGLSIAGMYIQSRQHQNIRLAVPELDRSVL